jgi:hypothetical protein
MHSETRGTFVAGVLIVCAASALQPAAQTSVGTAKAPQSSALRRIDLVELLAKGRLRPVNREVANLRGDRRGIDVSENAGPGVVWIEGSDFAEGTIELEVRGRDVVQRSFVGVAFHRRDDTTYDAVYVRPFNFRIADPARRQNAVQYIASPNYDWPRLRQEFPSEFENPVDPSVAPIDWLPLRVVVKASTIEVYVGSVTSPTLQVRKLGQHDRGMIGLCCGWVTTATATSRTFGSLQ